MKIGELSRLSSTSKETIHHYIRAGLLRKPRKTKENVANYNKTHLETLLLIKELRENYYTPLPEIKKVLIELKKRPDADHSSFLLQSRFCKPLDRLLTQEIAGREAFCEATGLGPKWLAKMEEWGVLAPKVKDGEPTYSTVNIILGKLIVALDDLGFGPKDGHKPEVLKELAESIREVLLNRHSETLNAMYGGKPINSEQLIAARKYEEIMGLLIYNLYKRIFREGYEKYHAAIGSTDTGKHHNFF